MEGLILETTFLVDIEREGRRGVLGRASAFLDRRPDEQLWITMTTLGELASGANETRREKWGSLVERYGVVPIDLDVCWSYGRAFKYLSENGLLIGANDLWIAAAAIANGLPLVTRNARHFRRVPGLTVIEY